MPPEPLASHMDNRKPRIQGALEKLSDEVKKDCRDLRQCLKRAETTLLKGIETMKEKRLTLEGVDTAKYSDKISPFINMIAEIEDCCLPAKDFLKDVESTLLMLKRYNKEKVGKHDAKRKNDDEEVLPEQKEAKKMKTVDQGPSPQASSSVIDLTASQTFKTKEGMSSPKKSTEEQSEILPSSFDNDAHEKQSKNRKSDCQDPVPSQVVNDDIIEEKSNPAKPMEWVKKYKANVRLDQKSASPWLILSEGGKCVANKGMEKKRLPKQQSRFTVHRCVLGRKGFDSGKHYWEVAVRKVGDGWCVGVAGESVKRDKRITQCPEEAIWAVGRWDAKDVIFISPETPLPLGNCRKLGVYLDYKKGELSILNAATMTQLYKFTHKFSENIFPYFNVRNRAELCLL